MITFGDLCCGGGGTSLGAIAAGLTPLFAIEHDAAIAACYRRNVGEHVIVGDVATADIASLARVDFLLASFPCQAHSVARSKSLAPRGDGDLALCILDYARILRPKVIVLENVPPWRKSAVYRTVVSGLGALGYFVDGQLVDASLHGVPQTRRRCIVRAVWGGLVPALPAPTARIGWYAALEDLLPGLPESRFAPWQLKRLSGLAGTTLVTNQYDQPSGTAGREAVTVAGANPSPPVLASDGRRWRAFLLDDQRSGKGGYTGVHRGATCALSDDPCFTVTAGSGTQRPLRAFLVHNQISQSLDAPMVRGDDEPAPIVTTNSGGRVRAFLQMNGNTQTAHPTGTGVLGSDEPSNTVTSGSAGTARAWLSRGRVVALDARCLARLMGFPDSYQLPESRSLAGKILGNAVPPELVRRILVGLLPVVERVDAGAAS